MSISIKIEIGDIVSSLSQDDLIYLLAEWFEYNTLNAHNEQRLTEVLTENGITNVYSDNPIEDLKLQDIMPNLNKKSLEEIQDFFCS